MAKPVKLLFISAIIVILIISLVRKGGDGGLPECVPFEGAEICTEQYQPVCAKTENAQKTFGNLCKACIAARSEKITATREGECE